MTYIITYLFSVGVQGYIIRIYYKGYITRIYYKLKLGKRLAFRTSKDVYLGLPGR